MPMWAISLNCCVTMVVPLTLSELLMSCRSWLYMGTREEGGFWISVIFFFMGRQDRDRKVEMTSWKGREKSSKLLAESCRRADTHAANFTTTQEEKHFALRSWHPEVGLEPSIQSRNPLHLQLPPALCPAVFPNASAHSQILKFT